MNNKDQHPLTHAADATITRSESRPDQPSGKRVATGTLRGLAFAWQLIKAGLLLFLVLVIIVLIQHGNLTVRSDSQVMAGMTEPSPRVIYPQYARDLVITTESPVVLHLTQTNWHGLACFDPSKGSICGDMMTRGVIWQCCVNGNTNRIWTFSPASWGTKTNWNLPPSNLTCWRIMPGQAATEALMFAETRLVPTNSVVGPDGKVTLPPNVVELK